MRVKICGITNAEDARKSCEYGADLLGFIFIKGTPRYVEGAHNILSGLSREVKDKIGKVGLFKDERIDDIEKIILRDELDYVQLHGEETPDYCARLKKGMEKKGRKIKIIKALKVSDRIMLPGGLTLSDYSEADFFVFDTYSKDISGGTGERFEPEILVREKEKISKPFFIAGGLTPLNVAEVVRRVRPFGVDVSSGVEKIPGKKDSGKLKEFIENAKHA